MYIPISPSNSSLRLEIRKKNSDDVHVKYLTFIQNRRNFHKKFTRRKCSWKYSPSTWKNYMPILSETYSTHITMVKKIPTHILWNHFNSLGPIFGDCLNFRGSWGCNFVFYLMPKKDIWLNNLNLVICGGC